MELSPADAFISGKWGLARRIKAKEFATFLQGGSC